MLGKFIKFFFLFFIVIFLLVSILRNYIIKFCIENYASKSLKAECKVNNVNLGLDFLSLDGLTIKTADSESTAKNITLKFKTQQEKPFLYISAINLSDVNVRVKSLEKSAAAAQKPKALPLSIFSKPVWLDFENISIFLKNKSLELSTNFSFIAEISRNAILLKDAKVTDLDVRSQDFEITKLNLRKFRKDRYLIAIAGIRIKDSKFTDFFIPVKTNVNQLLFPRAKNPFLGDAGFISAECSLNGYDSLCVSAKLQNASFEKIIDVFASEEASFKGLFDGSLEACADKFTLSKFKADFSNKGSGFINIKKESSFVFLKSYLDEPSYRALIDNFKNYEYNIGVVNANKVDDTLNLNLDFTSDAMGKRNIIVNFHNVSGGNQ
ncbi:MAG: hypothetical protein PHP17_02125 [Candidatus Omnitrophica bacterium]|nr:hypothetical protein [Candidatus Omnitrophota bacterium]